MTFTLQSSPYSSGFVIQAQYLGVGKSFYKRISIAKQIVPTCLHVFIFIKTLFKLRDIINYNKSLS